MLNLLNQEKLLGGVDANSPIGAAQSADLAKDMTRPTRTEQNETRKRNIELDKKIDALTAKIDAELAKPKDQRDMSLIAQWRKERDTLYAEKNRNQSHGSGLARVQNGTRTFATGGATTTTSDYDYGDGSSGGGSSGGGSAFTKPPTN